MVYLVLGTVVPSFLIALVAGFAMRRLAPKVGLVDRPGLHKQHGRVIPLGGGLAIWMAVIGTFALGQAALDAWKSAHQVGLARASSSVSPIPSNSGQLNDLIQTHA